VALKAKAQHSTRFVAIFARTQIQESAIETVPGRVRVTYEFIKAHRDQFSVQEMCRVLQVAQSGYYDWLQQPVSNRAQEDARLLRLIRASFVASHGIYGAPRVFLDLREAGETCSKHRVERLMRQPIFGRCMAIGRDAGPSGADPKPAAATIHRYTAKHGLGHRHHVHPHVAGLALPSRCHGSVLAPDRGVGRGTDDSPGARAQCRSDRGPATSASRHAHSFRSGNTVRE
jgi:hypothetical protein